MAKKPKPVSTSRVQRGLQVFATGISFGLRAANQTIKEAVRLGTEDNRKEYWLKQANSLVQNLGELKGGLQKAGQMLSMHGEHFLPKEANDLLKTLQRSAPPVPWTQIQKQLKKELGPEKLTSLEISPTPIGTASLAQVYHARSNQGQDLALKVQYPGIAAAMKSDLQFLQKMLSAMGFLPRLPSTDELFLEIREMMNRELDYAQEKQNLDFFREKLKTDHRFLLPSSLAEYSTKRVLCMTYLPSTALEEAITSLDKLQRTKVATALLDLFFQELLVWKKMQTDPHFGNYGYNLQEHKIVLYDFGSVRDLPDSFVEKYAAFLLSLLHEDRQEFEERAGKLNLLLPEDPQKLKDLFYELCLTLFEPFTQEEPYSWETSDLPKRVSDLSWKMVKEFPLRSPPREFVFLNRKIVGLYTILKSLQPSFPQRKLLLSALAQYE